ncbi:carbon-nitrogen hydrolase family protein [Lentiprolixibacter aurantiacus]|uniref:Carbon-nitrogen hydrolase family protein n=1 Tax=Lentiprolixibacter aurantiacus TaxID=2993939 RepID=A0AAE3SN82_9FLAO|nr:carbon-nitrogen hydrolase family protein [Lentiprolixibacter aurantiacus]MCX2718157.1 carbon-nitrogen hydrolase family protein [Lentiprolixibacter aurantiacus]
MDNYLKVGLAQIAPVWLDKAATTQKIMDCMEEGASNKAELLVFGEALLPGYPFWLAYTNGAGWDLKINKQLHAHYSCNAVTLEAGELGRVCDLAAKLHLAVYLGIIERPLDRGGHSLYCSLVYIDGTGKIRSVHRKLQPTYDERLTWAPGDGHGLRTHSLKQYTLGGLNCWENWMPLPRASLYAQGENLHIAVWPGNLNNTKDITRFIARESRSYVISVSSLMRKSDFPKDTPYLDVLQQNTPEVMANGGSCIAGPDGEWILEPVVDDEGILYASLDINRVFEERQNFDPAGHYSRPDVTQLHLNRERQSTLKDKADNPL